ncbi:hypothetical protein FQA47_010110 [Oryzias melastigma]|uniref:Uncharacterized protein n=1 Tax=Oryzias melastigma TaxID=30732 RepID=A0A834KWR8_ORYME|nr:hypothetical protein FQA47_010110 [Oryzias melastigma]
MPYSREEQCSRGFTEEPSTLQRLPGRGAVTRNSPPHRQRLLCLLCCVRAVRSPPACLPARTQHRGLSHTEQPQSSAEHTRMR